MEKVCFSNPESLSSFKVNNILSTWLIFVLSLAKALIKNIFPLSCTTVIVI